MTNDSIEDSGIEMYSKNIEDNEIFEAYFEKVWETKTVIAENETLPMTLQNGTTILGGPKRRKKKTTKLSTLIFKP